MFLKIYNAEVEPRLRLRRSELAACRNVPLYSLFVAKIASLLADATKPCTRRFRPDADATRNISRFLERVGMPSLPLSVRTTATATLEDALRWIDFFNADKPNLYFDGGAFFRKFVTMKILTNPVERDVRVYEDSVGIFTKRNIPTKVIPFWQFIDHQKLDIASHINLAVHQIRTTEFRQIYLVYPRHERFEKHIPIICKGLGEEVGYYRIKLVPYALDSILR